MSTRSKRTNPADDKDSVGEEHHILIDNSECKTQWMIFIDDSTLQHDPNNENKAVFCQLRHPRTDRGAMFLFANNNRNVFEVSTFSENCRSWLIDNTVQEDGTIHVTTPIDPLFLVLPYLQKAQKGGMYMTLDQIVCDEEFPECSRLLNTSGISEIFHITDMNGSDDIQAYRYNEEKLLSWLQAKANHVAEKLSEKNVSVAGAQSCTYIRTKRAVTANNDDYLRYAVGILSDYISVDLGKKLGEHMKIPEVILKKENEPPAKKAKVEDFTPSEDYSQSKSADKSQKVRKLTAGQKKLIKVDKSGMKSLASFFSPKNNS